jgi:hydroxypyruvate reductase
LTLVVSDVVGDDLSVIASGPTVPDVSRFADALAICRDAAGPGRYPLQSSSAWKRRARRAAGNAEARGALSHSYARVIGPQRGALDGARDRRRQRSGTTCTSGRSRSPVKRVSLARTTSMR